VIARFFDRSWQAGARALAASCREHHLQVAERALTLRFAGPALEARLLPALRHLCSGTRSSGGLEIALWDAASTGVGLEAPPWDWGQGVRRGAVQGIAADPRFSVQYQVESGMLSVLDRDAGRGILWMRDADRLPRPEAAPLLGLLSEALAPTVRIVHAGGVGTREGGVLLAGPGGSGKSTSVMACLGSALRLAGDDYLAVRADGAAHAYSLYASAKLDAASLGLLPRARRHAPHGPQQASAKALLLLSECCREDLIEGFPLRAIVLPRVTGGPSRLVPVPPMQALRRLAPSTLMQLPGADSGALETMGALAKRLPAFRLETGPDLDAIPGLLASVAGAG
jgi:hypothetical protein